MKRTAAVLLTWMLLGTLVTGFLAGPAGATPVTIHWLSDGSAEKTVTFDGEGTDSSLSLSIKKMSTINSFSMDLEGLPKILGGMNVVDHTFNNTTGISGWDGNIASLPPTLTTQCKTNTWPSKYVPYLTNVDALNMTFSMPSTITGGYACIHLQYTLDTLYPLTLRNEFYGKGVAPAGDGLKTYMYNFTNTTYDLLDTYDHGKMVDLVPIFTYINASASNYVNSNSKNVDIIITTLNPSVGNNLAAISVDFVKLVETYIPCSYPNSVTLDIAGDGSVEWSGPGPFLGVNKLTGSTYVTELQQHVTEAGTGDDNVTIPLKFYTAAAGLIHVYNITIDIDQYVNVAPFANGTIPNDKAFDEDTTAPGLLDLALYFKDDIQTPNQLTYTIVSQSDQTKIKATLATDGHHLDFTTPTKNWYGTQTFKVKATDDHGQSLESNTFNVTVRSVNDVPAFVPIGDRTAKEGTPFSIEVKTTDGDFEFGGDAHTFTISSPLVKIDRKPGTNDTAIISFTPTQAQVGLLTLTVTVKDKALASVNGTFNVTVENVNFPPVFQGLGDQTVTEGQIFKKQVKATDPDGDKIEFTDDTDLFVIAEETGMMEFTAKQADVGVHMITITASDGKADTDLMFNLTVLNKNDAPKVEPIADDEVDRDTEWSYTAIATDPDIGFDAKEALTFSISADPALSNMTIGKTTGDILVKTTKADVGAHTITVKVKDTAGLEGTAKFNLTVLLTNTPPTATIQVTTAKGVLGKAEAGENITLKATAEDRDGDTLTYKWEWTDGSPQTAEGETVTITIGETGMHNITLTVSDGIAETKATADIEITGSGGGGGKGGKGKNLIPGFEAPLALVAMAIAMVAILVTRKKKRHMD